MKVNYEQFDIYFCGSDFIKAIYKVYFNSNLYRAVINYFYNTTNNTIDYTYGFTFSQKDIFDDNKYKDKHIESIPESISLDTFDSEQDDVAKMVYSHEDYFEYIVTKKINTDEIMDKLGDRLSEALRYQYRNEENDWRNIHIQTGAGIKKSFITANRRYSTIDMEIHASIQLIPDDEKSDDNKSSDNGNGNDHSRIVKYRLDSYKIDDTSKVSYIANQPATTFEIEIPAMEFGRGKSELCRRLLEDYHILDDIADNEIKELLHTN